MMSSARFFLLGACFGAMTIGVPALADAERVLSVPEAVQLCAEANARGSVAQRLREAKRDASKEHKKKRKQHKRDALAVVAPTPGTCGDSICQDVVCAALGCPEPETHQTCRQDCSE